MSIPAKNAVVRFDPAQKNIKRYRYCIECIHYVPSVASDFQGWCRLVGKVDLVTGKKILENARVVRSDEDMCGETGRWYENNPCKNIK